MDDQNQTNQPLDQSTVPTSQPQFPPVEPVVSNQPEDITPVATPESTINEPTQPVQETAVPVAPVAPVTPEIPTPSLPTPPVSMEPNAPVEMPGEVPSAPSEPADPPMPEAKKKSKVLPIIGGIAALLLVVGVAGAAYYVSNQLSTRQAVAPTAPESEPQAAECIEWGTAECIERNPDNSCKTWKTPCKKYAGPAVTAQTCSAGTYACNTGCCPVGKSTPTPPPGGTGGGGGGSASCVTWTGYIANPTRDQQNQVICNPNKDKFNTVTFTEACVARIHLKSGVSATANVVTMTKSGVSAAITKIDEENWDVNVEPGTYTIAVKLGNETANSLGFRTPNASGICQMFGSPMNVSTYLLPATLKSLGIESITQVDRPVQCWSDMIKGEDNNTRGQLNSNYDFNDFTIAMGCKAAEEPGYCALLRLYKKVDGVYSPTHMTATDLQNMVVGDVYRMTVTNSRELLPTRFRVTVSGAEGAWMDGSFNATNKKIVEYNDFVITTPGTYKFEAQVVPIPMTGIDAVGINYVAPDGREYTRTTTN